jgi:hypothetical protein
VPDAGAAYVRQTRLLHDLLTELPLLRGIQPFLEQGGQYLDALGGDFLCFSRVFHANIPLVVDFD